MSSTGEKTLNWAVLCNTAASAVYHDPAERIGRWNRICLNSEPRVVYNGPLSIRREYSTNERATLQTIAQPPKGVKPHRGRSLQNEYPFHCAVNDEEVSSIADEFRKLFHVEQGNAMVDSNPPDIRIKRSTWNTPRGPTHGGTGNVPRGTGKRRRPTSILLTSG